MSFEQLKALPCVLCLALLGACGPSEPVPITLRFKAVVGSEEFSCNRTYQGLGTTGTSYQPRDFRFYVHDVRLLAEDGKEVPLAPEVREDGWQSGSLTLLDFEDKTGLCSNGTEAMNTTLTGRAPPGAYRGVRFTLGIPFEQNHPREQAAAASPLNLTSLFWGWQGGYKFLRVDGKTTGLPGFNIHVGSTGCVLDEQAGVVTSCETPNRVEVVLTGFDPTRQVIVADLARLVAETNLDTNFPDTPPGCMSAPFDTDCTRIFRNLGLPFGTPSVASPGQTFFRFE